jgi:predicted nucleotidyltransferase
MDLVEKQKIYKCLIILNKCLKMLNLPPNGYKRILELFIRNNQQIHLREISKRTGLNENSTYRFLNKLEQNNLLKSEKIGNMKFYCLQKNKKAYSTITLFDVESIDSLPALRKKCIDTFLLSISEEPIFALVFGSTATKTYKDESDIDILVVTVNKVSLKNAEKKAKSLSSIPIHAFHMTLLEFFQEIKEKKDMVIQSAIHTGIPLINHIRYYEVINNA